MKNNLFFIILIMGLSFFTTAKAETVLYCQSELATGFLNKNGTWKEANFKKERFTVKFNNDFTKLTGFIDWVENREMECSNPYYATHKHETYCVHLKGAHEIFLYNSQTKRFIASRITSTGWLIDEKDTDVIFAGTCRKF